MTDMERRFLDDPDRPYLVDPSRLVIVDGREYVRCPLHGLIALDHRCSNAPFDHWCRQAAHPHYDPATGVDGLDDQAVSHDKWDRIQSMKIRNWQRVAEQATEALRLADLYLDGFVWLSEPEFSELRAIKRASLTAQRRVTALAKQNGVTVKQSRSLSREDGGAA